MERSTILTLFAALTLTGILASCRTEVADVPGDFTFRGQAVHPAAISALYRSANGQIDLAGFKTNLEARQWEDQPGWWVTDFEDPASRRSPFFAYAAFAAAVSEGAEIYILSVAFNAGESADVDNIILLQKSGSWLGLIRAWNEGSACSGGILNERLGGENFLYSRELTPIDLLDLALDNKAIPTARGEAERTIKAAEGYALNRINRAKGDAARFRDVYEEYRKAKEITKTRLYLENMRSLLPKLGPIYIVDSEQKNTLPLLNFTKPGGK